MALDSRGIPPFPQRMMIYALTILLAVGLAIVGVRWFGMRGEEMILLEAAILFLVAGSGRAPRLFAAVRQGRRFNVISSDRVTGIVLIILALFMLLAVVFLHARLATT